MQPGDGDKNSQEGQGSDGKEKVETGSNEVGNIKFTGWSIGRKGAMCKGGGMAIAALLSDVYAMQ